MATRKDEFENKYKLPNRDESIESEEELDRILDDFIYLASHYMQIVDKWGNLRPFTLNRAQRKLVKKILPMIMKDTRVNRRQYVVVLKARQMGASVVMVALINFICAYVEGMNNMHIYHIFPVGGSGAKFYNNKVLPIITGVHPDIYPTMMRSYTDPVTKEITYLDTQGVPRNNRYEIVSSTASSLRGGTGQILILDEVADYEKPYDLEAAIVPAIPQTGFSLIMYLSTFSDKRSSYFLEKIQTARDEPQNWTLVFIPWYFSYPEERLGVSLEDLELTDYDKNVIIPALKDDEIPEEEWGDCISWYHETERGMPTLMKQEYPTTIQEVVELGTNERVFSKQDVDKQRKYVSTGVRCNVSSDLITRKPIITETTDSPFCVFKKPQTGHRYGLVADPITSVSDDSDFFAASVFDLSNNEQVATLRGRGLPEEDWAIYCEAIAKWYNRCWICPESNVAEGFKATIWNLGYYNWYYVNALARKNRTPGIRTTVGSKSNMVERLQYLLRNNNIILHDQTWIDELDIFERKVKRRGDNSNIVTYSAPKKQHDDCFVADTMVMTDHGEVRISEIQPGEMVLTSMGYRPVECVIQKRKEVLSKFGTTATPDHPYITPYGIKDWRDINIHDNIYLCPHEKKLKELLSNTGANCTTDTLSLRDANYVCTIGDMISGSKHQLPCTGRFMKIILGLPQKVGTFIILMATQIIIHYLTSKLCQRENTLVWRRESDGKTQNTLKEEDYLLQLLNQKRGYRKHRKTGRKLLKYVNSVKQSLKLDVYRAMLHFVLSAVQCGIAIPMGSTFLRGNKSNVLEESLYLTKKVSTSQGKKYATTYNLQVADVHEFYANGILVHNCVATLWIYAGTLGTDQLAGRQREGHIIVG